MVDWNNGKPNARFWALKMLKDNFSPGDKVVEVEYDNSSAAIFAVVTKEGKRRVLIVNERNHDLQISIAGLKGAELEIVDQTTAFDPPAHATAPSDTLKIGGLAVAVAKLP
jgi:hypothetical protein